MGGLRLYAYEKRISENEETQRLLWEKFEDQGNQWHTTNYQFSPQGKLEVSYSTSYKFECCVVLACYLFAHLVSMLLHVIRNYAYF